MIIELAHSAATRGNTQMIDQLIQSDIDFGTLDKDGKSLAAVAEEHGHEDVIERLAPNLSTDTSEQSKAFKADLQRVVSERGPNEQTNDSENPEPPTPRKGG